MTTPRLNPRDFAALGAPNLVYVREIKAAEVLAETPVDVVEGFELTPEKTLYALHNASGERLAVLIDRDSAFAAARSHELAPVSVH